MAVEFTSHGYDTAPGEGLGELTWQEMFPQLGTGYGVRSPGDWKVTKVSGADRTVSIAAGRGWGLGVIDKTVANDTIQLDAITSGSRWDLIACRRDPTPTKGVSEFVKINGGSTPTIPGGRLVGPGIHDQPLALVEVIAGQTQPGTIIDLRTWSGVGGGFVAVDALVLSFLNQTGTRININGVDWLRRPGANDVPEWASWDNTQSSASVTTFGAGWSATNNGGHKPRLFLSAGMVHLVGAVTQGSAANVNNMLTVPADFRPLNANATFVGSGVTSKGVAYELVLGNGVLSIDGGYLTGDFPVGSVVPVTASWPRA